VDGATSAGYSEDWDLDQLWNGLKLLYPVGVTVDDLEEEAGSRQAMDHDFLKTRLIEDAHAAYEAREEQLGSDTLRQMERGVLLQVIDRKWREHLYEMDYLKDGVGLRAYAQRDPLVEYQREGFDMFNQMLDGVKEEAVGFLYNAQIQYADEEEISGVGEAPVALRQAPSISPSAQRAQQQLLYSAPSIDGEAGSGGAVELQDAPALGIGTGNGARRGPARANGRTGARPAASGTRTGSTATKTTPEGAPTSPVPAASGARRVSLGSASGIGNTAGGSSPGAQAANRPSAPGQVVGGSEPSRNGPCPCGSGKKYKRCHGAPTA
jgi:preprotein translocase subunit SecA